MPPIKGSVRNPLQLSCRDFFLSNVQIEKEQMCWSQVQFNETEIAAECLKNSTQLCEDTAIDGTNITVHKLLIWQVNLMKPNLTTQLNSRNQVKTCYFSMSRYCKLEKVCALFELIS